MKSVLILGGGKCVFEDHERAIAMHDFDSVMAINDIGVVMHKVDFWVSMHPEKMPKWLEARRANGHPDPSSFWTSHDRAVPTGALAVKQGLVFNTIRNTRGGSGLLAIYAARYLKFDRIVLAGVPMTREQEHFHKSGWWKECNLYRVVWENNASLKEDVRSLSGWTRERFGEPTVDWLRPNF